MNQICDSYYPVILVDEDTPQYIKNMIPLNMIILIGKPIPNQKLINDYNMFKNDIIFIQAGEIFKQFLNNHAAGTIVSFALDSDDMISNNFVNVILSKMTEKQWKDKTYLNFPRGLIMISDKYLHEWTHNSNIFMAFKEDNNYVSCMNVVHINAESKYRIAYCDIPYLWCVNIHENNLSSNHYSIVNLFISKTNVELNELPEYHLDFKNFIQPENFSTIDILASNLFKIIPYTFKLYDFEHKFEDKIPAKYRVNNINEPHDISFLININQNINEIFKNAPKKEPVIGIISHLYNTPSQLFKCVTLYDINVIHLDNVYYYLFRGIIN